jgi:DNA-binding PadR family transcriptional regulator
MSLFERLQQRAGRHGGRRFAHGPHGAHEHGEGRFGRGGRGPGGRLARLLEHGDLRMLILHLIAEKPRHGYEIIKAIEDLAGGAYAPSPGVVYPTLTMLEELGQVSSTDEGNRKSFAITPAGAEALAANQAAVAAILARIAEAQPREAAQPVIRAMENLANVLRMKVRTKATSPEMVSKIVDTLDAIARKIEEF